MNIREIINETINRKDDARQRITIKEIGINTQEADLKEEEGKILREADFKDLNITNAEGRKAYVLQMTREHREDIQTARKRLREIQDEYIYYQDRYNFLMRLYEIDGEEGLETEFQEQRRIVVIKGE